jgi:hypothetical protein
MLNIIKEQLKLDHEDLQSSRCGTNSAMYVGGRSRVVKGKMKRIQIWLLR